MLSRVTRRHPERRAAYQKCDVDTNTPRKKPLLRRVFNVIVSCFRPVHNHPSSRVHPVEETLSLRSLRSPDHADAPITDPQPEYRPACGQNKKKCGYRQEGGVGTLAVARLIEFSRYDAVRPSLRTIPEQPLKEERATRRPVRVAKGKMMPLWLLGYEPADLYPELFVRAKGERRVGGPGTLALRRNKKYRLYDAVAPSLSTIFEQQKEEGLDTNTICWREEGHWKY